MQRSISKVVLHFELKSIGKKSIRFSSEQAKLIIKTEATQQHQYLICVKQQCSIDCFSFSLVFCSCTLLAAKCTWRST